MRIPMRETLCLELDIGASFLKAFVGAIWMLYETPNLIVCPNELCNYIVGKHQIHSPQYKLAEKCKLQRDS